MPDDGLNHREAKEIHETHADFFQIAPQGDFVALSFGELESEITSDGKSQPKEVVYDTRVKMTSDSLKALQKLIGDVLERNESQKEERDPSRGVH